MSTTTLPAPAFAPGPGEDLRADITTALEKLAAFGSADQIAEHLQHELIRGVCGNANECAIAEYLIRVVPAVGRSYAALLVSSLTVGADQLCGDRVIVTPPVVVSQFIERFDDGLYPGLTRLA